MIRLHAASLFLGRVEFSTIPDRTIGQDKSVLGTKGGRYRPGLLAWKERVEDRSSRV